MLSYLIWAPLAFGLIAALLPRRLAGPTAVLGTAVTLGIAIAVLAGFDSGDGMQYVTDTSWISGLGIDYSLGVDGISVFLVMLTAVVWLPATGFAAMREPDRPGLYFLMLLAGETATLGAFVAQDLILFVLFFDLMIVPFYFLFGIWGRDREGVTAGAATLKMIVYTLIGSLLMLVGAIAAGIIAADGGPLDFSIAAISQAGLPGGSQDWIFWFFAAAFLVKMPLFPLHGWMPDAYRAAPLPALAVFSGVLSKVGAYGFLRVVVPMLPDATSHYQEILLIVSLVSIVYGSAMAFTKTDLRLILGFSSVAQLGFITAGVFVLNGSGANGAVLQMVNHGLVVVPAFLIVAILAERAGGSEDIRRMGGLARRAPVLAAVFLIVTLATLAMPGSSNFIGEFYIVNGWFESKIAMAIIATAGIAMAAYYALRMFQRTMHYKDPEGLLSREIARRDGLVLVPLVLCILGLAFYPQFVLKHTDSAADQTVAEATVPPGANEQSAPIARKTVPVDPGTDPSALRAPAVVMVGDDPDEVTPAR